MSDRAAFIRSICEAPRDNARRLIFADWLDECGAEPSDRDRAAFIRSQVAYARLPARCDVDPGLELKDFQQPRFYRPRCRCRVCRPRMRSYYAGRRWISWEWSGEVKFQSPRWHRGFVHSLLTNAFEFRHSCLNGVMGQHPIMMLRLRNRPHEGAGGWHWYNASADLARLQPHERASVYYARIPDDVHEYLKSPSGRWQTPQGWWAHTYPTAADAEHTLAVAMIDFGRELAGLPKLGLPTTRPKPQLAATRGAAAGEG